jgi:hypothetical protein
MLLEFGLRRAQVADCILIPFYVLKLAWVIFFEKTYYFMRRDLMVGYQHQNIATLEDLMQQGNSKHLSCCIFVSCSDSSLLLMDPQSGKLLCLLIIQQWFILSIIFPC